MTSFVPDGDLLVSVLRKGSREVFVVVNRDPNAVSVFTATFAPGVKYVRKNGTRVPACDGAYPMDIGEAEIFVSDGNGGS